MTHQTQMYHHKQPINLPPKAVPRQPPVHTLQPIGYSNYSVNIHRCTTHFDDGTTVLFCTSAHPDDGPVRQKHAAVL